MARRLWQLPPFVTLVGCLLLAGPGAGVLDALVYCPHHAAVAQVGHDHGAHTRVPAGPCFCPDMTGGLHVALPPALPVSTATPLPVGGAVVHVPLPLPPTLRSTPPSPPRLPPPNARA